LIKHIPDLVNNPQISMARGMTLKTRQAYSPGLSDQTLAVIDMDLATPPLHWCQLASGSNRAPRKTMHDERRGPNSGA
jgi:hypothetical protein